MRKVDAKQRAILEFSQRLLKEPSSRLFLHRLLNNRELVDKMVFVLNRRLLANTLLVSELGSSRIGFQLELGARRQEEVSLVNGRLVRNVKRTRRVCLNDPMEAWEALENFEGRLYTQFSFAGEIPDWYLAVVEPNPALPAEAAGPAADEEDASDIFREQLDIALWVVLLKQEIDQALAEKDEQRFYEIVGLYNRLKERCLWEFD
ncbi:MAG: IDEAL domain-containing protein [Firmicutes bacterium]|nr:IDEAL domain-containing protein [Bacillota bacterium]